MNKHMKSCNWELFSSLTIDLETTFTSKTVHETLWSNSIYKSSCGSYTASYIGKTYRHFKVSVSEHQGVSPRTGKPVKGTLSTSVRDHILVCDHKVVHEDFKFLGTESNRYLLEFKESLFIKRDRPSLNNLYSQELLLFWVFHIGLFLLSNFATDIILIISISEISKYLAIVFMS